MPMFMKALIDGVTEKKTSDGRKIFKGTASSLSLDRHKEVVVPRGANVANFIENQVLMSQHDYRMAPIGTVLSFEPNESDIPFTFAFDESDPEATRLMKKVENKTMRTFSIGFIPSKWVEQEEMINGLRLKIT